MSRTGAGERLARLLSIVPWVVAHDGPTVDEVCRRFSLSERELVADLELLFMCGAYPYTPDSLIDVDIDDGRVWVRFADWFRRPLRLSAPEGLALVAASRAMLDMARTARAGAPADGSSDDAHESLDAGPLSSALAKLEDALGLAGERPMDVELGPVQPQVLGLLREALATRHKVRIEYYSFGRDATSERVVHPWRVFSSEGHWYLLAWCEHVNDRRLFRVDRVGEAHALDEPFSPPRDVGPLEVFERRPEDPLVVLDVAPPARWLVHQYPNEEVLDSGEGHVQVSLRAGSKAWLERLLLRAGPAVQVVSGAEGVRETAARRLLDVYLAVTSKG